MIKDKLFSLDSETSALHENLTEEQLWDRNPRVATHYGWASEQTSEKGAVQK